MKKIHALVVAIIWAVTLNVHALEIQWSHGFTADCDNASERDDGTPLPVSEIYMVNYLIMAKGDDPLVDSPVYHIEMLGGCMPVPVDTKNVLAPGEYDIYGVTVDTSQPNRLNSIPSTPAFDLRITKNRPKPPTIR